MHDQYPILIVLIPLFGALLVCLVARIGKRACLCVTVSSLALSLLAAVETMKQVVGEPGSVRYNVGDWPPPLGIELVVDELNGMILIIICIVALFTAVFSHHSIVRELSHRHAQFYSLFLLCVVGLLGMTITGDAFNLYVMLEVSALSGYALIAMGRDRAPLAAFNYIIIGTVGASFYLVGIGFLYIKTGTLNMADLAVRLPDLYHTPTIKVAFAFIIIGILIKMAFFPVHAWLPNAYTYAPSVSSCLIAPLMTKVSVYVMIRMMFTVFTVQFVTEYLPWREIVVWLSVVAIFAGVVMAWSQTSVKKMLTYLVVAEIGYMVGGIWLCNLNGTGGAILHILNDAMMTFCLFLAVGAVVYKTGGHTLDHFNGLYRRMPWTMAGFTVAGMAMIGVPPTCGFFSKWFLIRGAIDAGHWGFFAALIGSSLVIAVLVFRVIERAYYHEPIYGLESAGAVNEAPLSMTAPLITVAVWLILLGLAAGDISIVIERFLITAGIS